MLRSFQHGWLSARGPCAGPYRFRHKCTQDSVHGTCRNRVLQNPHNLLTLVEGNPLADDHPHFAGTAPQMQMLIGDHSDYSNPHPNHDHSELVLHVGSLVGVLFYIHLHICIDVHVYIGIYVYRYMGRI